MFRALWWKAWRKLWGTVVIFLLLAILSAYFMMRLAGESPADVLYAWNTAILCIIAFAVPFLLFGEFDNRFLISRPLAPSRVWWSFLFIGISLLAANGLAVYGSTTAVIHFLGKPEIYKSLLREKGLIYLCIPLFSYSLSMFLSCGALASGPGRIFLLFVCLPAGILAAFYYDPYDVLYHIFLDNPVPSWFRILILCPALLLGSSVFLTGKHVWRRPAQVMAKGYAVSAALTLVLTAVGIVYLYSKADITLLNTALPAKRPPLRPPPGNIEIAAVSTDGSRLVLIFDPDGSSRWSPQSLITLDLAENHMYSIDRGGYYKVALRGDGATFIYLKGKSSGFPLLVGSNQAILSDFRGREKVFLLDIQYGLWGGLSGTDVAWSTDGSHIGVLNEDFDETGERDFVALYNAAGNLVGKSEFPVLENSWIHPCGWDSESRLYFSKHTFKGEEGFEALWRVSPDNAVPERVSFGPDCNYRFLQISPRGDFILYYHVLADGGKQLWIYSILDGTSRPVSDSPTYFIWSPTWAPTENKLAYLKPEKNAAVDDADEYFASLLLIYDPEQEVRSYFPLEKRLGIEGIVSWSLSGDYILLKGKTFQNIFALSIQTGEIIEMQPVSRAWYLEGHWKTRLKWTVDDRLLWATQNRLMSTEYDGSNPREILRIEDGRFYFDGEGKS